MLEDLRTVKLVILGLMRMCVSQRWAVPRGKAVQLGGYLGRVRPTVRGARAPSTPSTTYPRGGLYGSQLKSDRAEVHRRLAAGIESGSPALADQNVRADRRTSGGRR